MGMGGEGQDSGDSLLIGAWRGAPDGTGTDQRGGYYTGVVDNIEVSFSTPFGFIASHAILVRLPTQPLQIELLVPRLYHVQGHRNQHHSATVEPTVTELACNMQVVSG